MAENRLQKGFPAQKGMGDGRDSLLKSTSCMLPRILGPKGTNEDASLNMRAPRAVYGWTFGLGVTTLLLELLLIRVFDVIVGATAAYSILTLALLGGSLSGAWLAIRPNKNPPQDSRWLVTLFPLAVLLVYLVLQFVPFAVDDTAERPLLQLSSLALAVVAFSLPFFVSGYVLLRVFSAYPHSVRRLYGADLIGAGLGPWLLAPLIPTLGPVGILALLVAAHLGLGGWMARSRDGFGWKSATWFALALALAFAIAAGTLSDWDLRIHSTKRSADETRRRASAEFRHWDPISKIEIADLSEMDPVTNQVRYGTNRKVISYDGGSQSSHYYPFDGDFAALKAGLPHLVLSHFWQRGLLAGHWMMRDQEARTFVVGCSGGQEIKAALLFGAKKVHAVDLVSTVVRLGHEDYADYTGGIFLDPRVNYRVQDARQALAQSEGNYDLIQIFSYHNSARLAAGGGAVKAFYLQTVETYALCLSRLAPDGILQINQAFHPRVIATLSEAWHKIGEDHFKPHVVVYAREGGDDHTTLMVRKRPWTETEIRQLDGFLLPEYPGEDRIYRRVESPHDSEESFLPDGFYEYPLRRDLLDRAGFRASPVTDNRPFAQFLRKHLGSVPMDANTFVDEESSEQLSRRPVFGVPRDVGHLYATGLAGLMAWIGLMGLRAIRQRRLASTRSHEAKSLTKSPAKPLSLTHEAGCWLYFAALGGAFLTLESIWIQYGIQWMARPDLAFPAALSATLVPAGIGSMVSARSPRWAQRAFPILVGLGLLLIWAVPQATPTIWNWPTPLQLLAYGTVFSIFGFFLGMPLPLALSRLAETPETLGWCWTMHGVGTVLGGLAGICLSLFFGLQLAAFTALLTYAGVGILARTLGWFRAD